MKQVNIRDARSTLSKLIRQAVESGESFVIAKARKPMVKIVPLQELEKGKPRIGFMRGRFQVPDDFNDMYRREIAALFGGPADPPR